MLVRSSPRVHGRGYGRSYTTARKPEQCRPENSVFLEMPKQWICLREYNNEFRDIHRLNFLEKLGDSQ